MKILFILWGLCSVIPAFAENCDEIKAKCKECQKVKVQHCKKRKEFQESTSIIERYQKYIEEHQKLIEQKKEQLPPPSSDPKKEDSDYVLDLKNDISNLRKNIFTARKALENEEKDKRELRFEMRDLREKVTNCEKKCDQYKEIFTKAKYQRKAFKCPIKNNCPSICNKIYKKTCDLYKQQHEAEQDLQEFDFNTFQKERSSATYKQLNSKINSAKKNLFNYAQKSNIFTCERQCSEYKETTRIAIRENKRIFGDDLDSKNIGNSKQADDSKSKGKGIKGSKTGSIGSPVLPGIDEDPVTETEFSDSKEKPKKDEGKGSKKTRKKSKKELNLEDVKLTGKRFNKDGTLRNSKKGPSLSPDDQIDIWEEKDDLPRKEDKTQSSRKKSKKGKNGYSPTLPPLNLDKLLSSVKGDNSCTRAKCEKCNSLKTEVCEARMRYQIYTAQMSKVQNELDKRRKTVRDLERELPNRKEPSYTDYIYWDVKREIEQLDKDIHKLGQQLNTIKDKRKEALFTRRKKQEELKYCEKDCFDQDGLMVKDAYVRKSFKCSDKNRCTPDCDEIHKLTCEKEKIYFTAKEDLNEIEHNAIGSFYDHPNYSYTKSRYDKARDAWVKQQLAFYRCHDKCKDRDTTTIEDIAKRMAESPATPLPTPLPTLVKDQSKKENEEKTKKDKEIEDKLAAFGIRKKDKSDNNSNKGGSGGAVLGNVQGLDLIDAPPELKDKKGTGGKRPITPVNLSGSRLSDPLTKNVDIKIQPDSDCGNAKCKECQDQKYAHCSARNSYNHQRQKFYAQKSIINSGFSSIEKQNNEMSKFRKIEGELNKARKDMREKRSNLKYCEKSCKKTVPYNIAFKVPDYPCPYSSKCKACDSEVKRICAIYVEQNQGAFRLEKYRSIYGQKAVKVKGLTDLETRVIKLSNSLSNFQKKGGLTNCNKRCAQSTDQVQDKGDAGIIIGEDGSTPVSIITNDPPPIGGSDPQNLTVTAGNIAGENTIIGQDGSTPVSIITNDPPPIDGSSPKDLTITGQGKVVDVIGTGSTSGNQPVTLFGGGPQTLEGSDPQNLTNTVGVPDDSGIAIGQDSNTPVSLIGINPSPIDGSGPKDLTITGQGKVVDVIGTGSTSGNQPVTLFGGGPQTLEGSDPQNLTNTVGVPDDTGIALGQDSNTPVSLIGINPSPIDGSGPQDLTITGQGEVQDVIGTGSTSGNQPVTLFGGGPQTLEGSDPQNLTNTVGVPDDSGIALGQDSNTPVSLIGINPSPISGAPPQGLPFVVVGKVFQIEIHNSSANIIDPVIVAPPDGSTGDLFRPVDSTSSTDTSSTSAASCSCAGMALGQYNKTADSCGGGLNATTIFSTPGGATCASMSPFNANHATVNFNSSGKATGLTINFVANHDGTITCTINAGATKDTFIINFQEGVNTCAVSYTEN